MAPKPSSGPVPRASSPSVRPSSSESASKGRSRRGRRCRLRRRLRSASVRPSQSVSSRVASSLGRWPIELALAGLVGAVGVTSSPPSDTPPSSVSGRGASVDVEGSLSGRRVPSSVSSALPGTVEVSGASRPVEQGAVVDAGVIGVGVVGVGLPGARGAGLADRCRRPTAGAHGHLGAIRQESVIVGVGRQRGSVPYCAVHRARAVVAVAVVLEAGVAGTPRVSGRTEAVLVGVVAVGVGWWGRSRRRRPSRRGWCPRCRRGVRRRRCRRRGNRWCVEGRRRARTR